jgi:hypothetical protein
MRDIDTDGCDLPVLDPDTDLIVTGCRLDPVGLAEKLGKDSFQSLDIGFDTQTQLLEVKNGISHELPRAVIGHIPSASGVNDLDPPGGKKFFGSDYVRPCAEPPYGDHRRMLNKDESIGHFSFCPEAVIIFLNGQSGLITATSQLNHM